jgi:hypothetical protein
MTRGAGVRLRFADRFGWWCSASFFPTVACFGCLVPTLTACWQPTRGCILQRCWSANLCLYFISIFFLLYTQRYCIEVVPYCCFPKSLIIPARRYDLCLVRVPFAKAIMRLKLEHAVTANRVSCHPECIRKLCHNIHAFTATANHAVVSLYAISQICWSNFGSGDIQRDLAGKLMAIVGALSSLHEILDATPELSLLSASDVEILTQIITKCGPIIHINEAAIQKLDDYLAAQTEKNTRIQSPGLYNAFNPGEEKEPTSLLSECFLAIMHAIVTAKAESPLWN